MQAAQTTSPGKWNPGLENDHLTLREVRDTLPGIGAPDVAWYVRMIENPKSPLHLPGAVDLGNHDCIHILLGRGLKNQDEAFVIGFTMGASGACARWQQALFRDAAQWLYKGVYHFDETDIWVYDFAVEIGRRAGTKQLHTVEYESLMDLPLGDVRRVLGINKNILYAAFAIERACCPGTPVSKRLPDRRLKDRETQQ